MPSPEHDASLAMLGSILSLADPATWQSSADLAVEAVSTWLDRTQVGDLERVYLVGCGSSLYNGQVGKYAFEHIAHLPAEALPAFSFAAYAELKILGPKTLVVGISTTGKTAAVCGALQRARQAGARTLAVTAQVGSEVTHFADAALPTGGENDRLSVKTSSYVQALITLYVLAALLAQARRTADDRLVEKWLEQVKKAGQGAEWLLTHQREEIQSLGQQFSGASNVFVFGSGPNTGTAEEAALKVIEMAKMHAHSQDLENFLHGRLRQVDQVNPLFFIAPQGNASARTLDFLTVTDYVKAPTVVLTDEVTPGIQKLATYVIQMPGGLDEFATPLLYIIPMHLFGYELALGRGYDPNARRYNIVPQNVRYGDVL
jgi:glutamine---fructose-6-phosphate transaminase (isomerizing)